MEPREILELSARHYKILEQLVKCINDYPSLKKATGIGRTSLERYLTDLEKAGLVDVIPSQKAKGPKKKISINKLGRDTFDFIKNYEKLLSKLALDEAAHDRLKELFTRLEDPELSDGLKEVHFNELLQLGHSKPEILIYQELRDYIEIYIQRQGVNRYIDDFINYYIIKNVEENLELKEWFYAKLFNNITDQFQNKQLDKKIRKARLMSLWDVLLWDEDKRDEIIKSVVDIFEAECIGPESEWCKSIRMSYPITLKREILDGFYKYARKETTNRFFERS